MIEVKGFTVTENGESQFFDNLFHHYEIKNGQVWVYNGDGLCGVFFGTVRPDKKLKTIEGYL